MPIKKQHGGVDMNNTNTIANTNSITIKRLPYDIKIFSIMCILGVVIRGIFITSGNDIALSTIWSYGFSILALCGLLASAFALSSRNKDSASLVGFFKLILNNALPVVLLICILSLVLYQNIHFYSQINDNKVPDEYFMYSKITSFLILVQIVIVIKYLMDVLAGTNSNSSTNESNLMNILAGELYNISFIFTVLNLGFIAILQVILQFFSTGG